MTDNDNRIAELIADKLVNGLFHPGDPANEQEPMTLRLPMFRTVAAPPELVRQVDLTVKLMAEAIVYAIENDGQCDIVPRPLVQDEPQSEVEDVETMRRRVNDDPSDDPPQ